MLVITLFFKISCIHLFLCIYVLTELCKRNFMYDNVEYGIEVYVYLIIERFGRFAIVINLDS